MVEPEAVATMLRLKELGWGWKRSARKLGANRPTLKRYLETGGWQPYKKPLKQHPGVTKVILRHPCRYQTLLEGRANTVAVKLIDASDSGDGILFIIDRPGVLNSHAAALGS